MGSSNTQPEASATSTIVATDHIVPVRWSDSHFRVAYDYSFRFEDVLDPVVLRAALDRLIQIRGWRKIGARLRLNSSGGLDYHIPAEFSEERRPFLFTTEKHNMCISEHPILSQLPPTYNYKQKSNKGLKVFDGHQDICREHLRHRDAPGMFEDWLQRDVPQLAFHVICFQDTTFVTMTGPHTLFDASGIMAVMNAWAAILRGDEASIPPFFGYDADEDPLKNLHEGVPPSKYMHSDKLVQGTCAQNVPPPEVEALFVSIPAQYVERLREAARDELAKESKGNDRPWISDSDALSSWWARITLKAHNPSPNRSVAFINMFEYRDVLAKMGRLPAPDVVFLGNVIYASTTLFRAGKLLTDTLGSVAMKIRDSVAAHRTPEQIQAQAAMVKHSIETAGRTPVYGDPDRMIVHYTNWHRVRPFHLDFSPAVIPSKSTNPHKGKPVLMISTPAGNTRFTIPNSTLILGKDNSKTWWMKVWLGKTEWARVKEMLESLDIVEAMKRNNVILVVYFWSKYQLNGRCLLSDFAFATRTLWFGL
ncbi:putative LysR family regulatory protein [Xylariaceae sp. FL1019]|nr:putative LysR family regulatory protein [Xylariaceae sp. FL1019]